MADESLYLSTYEAALAVVATSMKKARLLLDTLIVNLFMGGLLFATGGMLNVLVVQNCPEALAKNPGLVSLMEGFMYPIGLFYVVIMGVDLFNSNILFFTVGVCRGAVSIIDLAISWFVSYWFNLVGNIFVCYLFCHYSNVAHNTVGTRRVLEFKANASFVDTLLKAMAGNFFVCLAIYLQLMTKPLHVKFLMLILPVFSFVAVGFTHCVADMFVAVLGLIDHADVSVATVAWRLFVPGAIGNIIGGSFFAIVLPWYLHLFVVERDRRKLNLPAYDMRDEQPELNADSRVVRVSPDEEAEAEEEGEKESEEDEKEESSPRLYDGSPTANYGADANTSLSSSRLGLEPTRSLQPIGRRQTNQTVSSRKSKHKSPANVFPVYGMGDPGDHERSIASGTRSDDAAFEDASSSFGDLYDGRRGADYLGNQLKKTFTRSDRKSNDLESSISRRSRERPPSVKSISFPARKRTFSFGSSNDATELSRRYTRAGITRRAANAADEAAGTSSVLDHIPAKPAPVKKKTSQPSVDPLTLPYDSVPEDPYATRDSSPR